MSVEYLEITDPLYIPECVAIQKEFFELSALDMYPSSFFSLLIRKEHPLGMLVGCFVNDGNKKTLVGLITLLADTGANTFYCLFVGLKPEYRDGLYGYNLTLAAKKFSELKGITTIKAIIDPLEANVIKLYLHLGVKFIKYINNPYKLDTHKVMGIDKALFKWEFDRTFSSRESDNKIKLRFQEIIDQYTIVEDSHCTDETFLIEIPDKFMEMLENNEAEANKWRIKTRQLFTEYMNNKGYAITDFVSGKINKQKKIYYLLQKNHA
jgi:predicted GNAT superfamily acetyltransferase